MTGRVFRSAAAMLLAAAISVAPAYGQATQQTQPTAAQTAAPTAYTVQLSQYNYSRGPKQFPNLVGPYFPIKVPEPQFANSPRVEQLIHDGKMELALQDAISLALENNLDIAVQRYAPWIADTDILRTMGGGAARGLTGTGTASVLGNIPSQSYDPVVTSTLSWDRTTSPVNNPFISGTGVPSLTALTSNAAQANFAYSQGFHTGTAYSIAFNNRRASTTSPAAIFNPSVNSSLFFSFSQQLLNGFGLLPNTRNIRIAKGNRKIADLAFKQQVITTVTQVQNLYWEYVFAREDVKVKERSVQLNEKLYNDNKRQVEIGTLAPIEVVRAEAEMARSRQDLIVSQTVQLQQQTLLKNAITKSQLDPTLLSVEIIPTESARAAGQPEIIPFQDAVKQAWESRPDILQAQQNLKIDDITARATRNALLPTVTLLGQYGASGLGGNSRVAGAIVPGGLSDALRNVYENNFPQYSVQLSMNIPIRNRPAQADSARALLQQHQDETRLRQLQNTIVVDVRNAQIVLEQNRARVETASKSRTLQEQTLDAEQKKYQLGASTLFFVIQAQRDLSQAQSIEVRALVDLMKAKNDFDRALGRTLEANRINIADAKRGQVSSDTLIPGTSASGEVIGERMKF